MEVNASIYPKNLISEALDSQHSIMVGSLKSAKINFDFTEDMHRDSYRPDIQTQAALLINWAN